MRAVKAALFLLLIAVFLYLFYLMVIGFFTGISLLDSAVKQEFNNSVVQVYYEYARAMTINVFVFIAVGLFLAFIVALIVLVIECVLYEHRKAF